MQGTASPCFVLFYMLSLLIRKIFPYLERMFRFLRTDKRQAYLLGILSTDISSFISDLRGQGFEDQLFAWVDDGQIASLRKLDGVFQYHLRIFNDGEVRGHYEYAPEAAPLKHLQRVAQEARSRDFSLFIQNHVSRELSCHTDYATPSSDMQVHVAASY